LTLKPIYPIILYPAYTGEPTMKELIKRVAESLVDYPDQVSVKEIQGDRLVVYELNVSKSDMGKIIGKKGRNVDAIRTILKAVAVKLRKRVLLELVE
jgi:predicted RNA-binding protein YlqC (UPF0109 family)